MTRSGAEGESVDPRSQPSVSVSVHADTVRLRLQNNTAIAVLYCLFLGLCGFGLVAVSGVTRSGVMMLAAAGLGGAAAAALVMIVRNRRRLTFAREVTGAYLCVDSEGVTATDLPRVPWSEVLGVVIADRRQPLGDVNTMVTLARWSARVSGRSLVTLVVGVRAPQRYARGHPGRGPWEVVSESSGLLVLDLDTVLWPDDSDRLRTAIRGAATEAGVAFLELSESSEIARARQAMRSGERLPDLR